MLAIQRFELLSKFRDRGVLLSSICWRTVTECGQISDVKGQRVSFSGLVEIALRELTNRRDLGDVLRRYGARARRN